MNAFLILLICIILCLSIGGVAIWVGIHMDRVICEMIARNR